MKSYLLTACALSMALSLGACSKDDSPQRGKVSVPETEKPGKPVEPLKALAEVTVIPGASNAKGEVMTQPSLELVVSLPEADGLTATEYSLKVETASLAVTDEKVNGGSDVLNMQINGEVQEMVQAQILDVSATKILVVRFADKDLVTGQAYLFVRNELGVTSLAKQVNLEAGKTDDQLDALIDEAMSTPEAETSQEETSEESEATTYTVTDSQGNTHEISYEDLKNNRGK